MPIIENSPAECFDRFTDHVRELVAATITDRYPLLPLPTESATLQLSFREQDPVAIPIETDHGRLYFYLGQLLRAESEADGRFRLRTLAYWYRLQHDAPLTAKAALRWEYDATIDTDRHARHHAQMATQIELGSGSLDLNKAHVPTGWVTFEEVIRFLIHDLGLRPPCGDDWPAKLVESERKFYEDFTGKRYREEAE